MDPWPTYPLVYEINTAVWLTDLSRRFDRPITLGTVPPSELEWLAASGFDAVWLMGVWERSPQARYLARTLPALPDEYRRVLPDYREQDCIGSPYAIHAYRVERQFGDDGQLAALRSRLAALGVRLILDFVPNHLAVDHPWLTEHPERFVHGTATDLERRPGEYFRPTPAGPIIAHGRDRYYVWTDTAQVDYRRAETRGAMSDALLDVAHRCDGVRCDMAMLLLRDVFLEQWGGTFDDTGDEFWSTAIRRVKERNKAFLFVAEVYWDLEYALQRLGFDFTYDRRLYERLHGVDADAVRAHLRADLAFQRKLLRFVENHDEPRAAAAFGVARSTAAALVSMTVPGMRLIHQGQMDGRRTPCPIQLQRCRVETPDAQVVGFYRRLLEVLREPALRDGDWQLLEPHEVSPGDPTFRSFVAGCWTRGRARQIVAVNLGAHRGQCFVRVPFPDLAGRLWLLRDRLNDREYERDGDDLASRGLYVQLDAYDAHAFDVKEVLSDRRDADRARP